MKISFASYGGAKAVFVFYVCILVLALPSGLFSPSFFNLRLIFGRIRGVILTDDSL